MIVGESFLKLFKDMEITVTDNSGTEITRPIKFWYGDHEELLRWLSKNKGNANKFPLVWYPITEVRERLDWKLVSNGSLVILSDTKLKYMNDERYVNTYSYIIDPVWQLIKEKLMKSSYFFFIGNSSKIEDRYVIRDRPNFDSGSDKKEFNNEKGQESIATDIVDARFIDFSFEINTKCI